jgi:tetratricopeptide (TPR) repeat protein
MVYLPPLRTKPASLSARIILWAFFLVLASDASVHTGSRAQGRASAEEEIEQLIARSQQHIPNALDSAVALGTRAVELTESGVRPELRVDALINMGFVYFRRARLDSAQGVLQEALEISQNAGYVRGTGIALNRLGNVCWLLDEQVKAKSYYERALTIHSDLGDAQEIGRTLNHLATVYSAWGDYQRAIELFLEARARYREVDYEEGTAWLNFSLTILHKKLGDYERALETINAALVTYRALAQQSGDSAGVMICYGQLGDIYNSMDQPEQGLDYHLRALRMREATGVKPAIADGLSGVGKSYYGMGDYERALDYFQRSQAVRGETEVRRGTETNFKFMGAIEREMGRYAEALEYLTQGLEVARELNERDTESEILEMIADVHALQGHYEKAWELFRQHRIVQDGVMNAEISKRIASMQLQHEIEVQAVENEQLQRENRIKDLQLARSRTQLILLVLLIAFIASGGVVAVYLHRKRLQIKILSGLIPICAHCKKIRNDGGYYEQLEEYISSHSEAQFTHGICPECAQEHYGQFWGDAEKPKS